MTARQDMLRQQGLDDLRDGMITARRGIAEFDGLTVRLRAAWERLPGRLDGKAAFGYTSQWKRIGLDARRAALALRIYECGTVPAEIRRPIAKFKGSARGPPDLRRQQRWDGATRMSRQAVLVETEGQVSVLE